METKIAGMDPIAYANLWGDPKTWHGQRMYTSPEQAEEFGRAEWAEFTDAVTQCMNDVLKDPDAYQSNDLSELAQLKEWAQGHYVADE